MTGGTLTSSLKGFCTRLANVIEPIVNGSNFPNSLWASLKLNIHLHPPHLQRCMIISGTTSRQLNIFADSHCSLFEAVPLLKGY